MVKARCDELVKCVSNFLNPQISLESLSQMVCLPGTYGVPSGVHGVLASLCSRLSGQHQWHPEILECSCVVDLERKEDKQKED